MSTTATASPGTLSFLLRHSLASIAVADASVVIVVDHVDAVHGLIGKETGCRVLRLPALDGQPFLLRQAILSSSSVMTLPLMPLMLLFPMFFPSSTLLILILIHDPPAAVLLLLLLLMLLRLFAFGPQSAHP